MSSITSNFSALAANYLSNNIHRLERSTGCFVCMLCDIEQWRGTWNPDHFLSHVKQVHPDLDFLACIFCGLNWPIDKFVKHVVDHLSPNCSPSPVFACPVQSSQSHSSTPCSFQTNSLQTLRFHVFSVHRNNKNFKCSQCSHQETEFATWADHIKTHTFRLSHCTADGCNVKSPSGELLIKHAKQKHGAHFGGSVRDSIEVSSGVDVHGRPPTLSRLIWRTALNVMSATRVGCFAINDECLFHHRTQLACHLDSY